MNAINKTAIAFLKVGESKHNEEIRNIGRLRFGSLHSYVESEDNSRVDKLETAIHIETLLGDNIFTLNLQDKKEIRIKVDKANIRKSIATLGYAFCLFAVEQTMIQENSWQLATNMIDKGDSILLINNPKEFIRRVEAAIEKRRLKVQYDFVRYKTFDGYTGSKSVFEKDMAYSDEHEFRFYIDCMTTNEPMYIEVGDLSDISIIIECNKEVGGPRFLLKSNNKEC